MDGTSRDLPPSFARFLWRRLRRKVSSCIARKVPRKKVLVIVASMHHMEAEGLRDWAERKSRPNEVAKGKGKAVRGILMAGMSFQDVPDEALEKDQ